MVRPNRLSRRTPVSPVHLTLVTALIAAGTLAEPPGTHAAAVRLTWQHPGETAYEIYVSQATEGGAHFFVERVGSTDAADGDAFRSVGRGLHPLRTAFFIMVAIDDLGRASAPSRILGVTAEDFCMAFDVDGDGAVTAMDVLRVLRRVVGVEERNGVTVSDAYEILTFANELGCEERLARAESPSR